MPCMILCTELWGPCCTVSTVEPSHLGGDVATTTHDDMDITVIHTNFRFPPCLAVVGHKLLLPYNSHVLHFLRGVRTVLNFTVFSAPVSLQRDGCAPQVSLSGPIVFSAFRCCHCGAWADSVLSRMPFASEEKARTALDDCWSKLASAGITQAL